MNWRKRLTAALLSLAMALSLFAPWPQTARAAGTGAAGSIGLTVRFDLPQTRAAVEGRGVKLTLTRGTERLELPLAAGTAVRNDFQAPVSVKAKNIDGVEMTTEARLGYYQAEVSGLAQGTYRLEVTGTGYVPYSADVTLDSYSRHVIIGTGDGTFALGDVNGDGVLDEQDLTYLEARLGGEQEITREMIADLRRRAAQNIPQERDVIDVAPVKFTVDNKTTVNPVGSYGTTVGARMCVLSCAPVIKRMIRRVIFEKVGLEINGYVARPLAEGALALTDEERRMGAMLVDLGAETTSVTIYKNGAPVYVATLPLGSRNITLDITHALNHIEERAEEIKKVSGNALGAESGRRTGADGIDYSEVNNYVHARAAEIITNILKQIEYAGMRTTDLPGGIVLIGGGSRLRGFNELLTQMSKMKVRMGTTQSAVRISDSAVNAADNIDVISTLVAAAQLPEAECMTEPEPEAEAETGSDEYDDSHDDDDDNVSRIGLEDDDDDDFATGKNKKPRKTSDSEEPSGKSRIFSWLRSRIATAMDEGDDM